MNFLQLTEEKLDVNRVTELVSHESCWAVSLFVGTTRDNFENKQVIQLKYEAYHKMAQKTLNKICDEIRSKWPDVKHIAIYHRLGVVPIKESSVVIAISSPHRQESVPFQFGKKKYTEAMMKVLKHGKKIKNANGLNNRETSNFIESILKIEYKMNGNLMPNILVRTKAPILCTEVY